MLRWLLVPGAVLLSVLAIVPAPPERPPLASGSAPPGVCVRVKATTYVTHADSMGKFILPLQGRWTAQMPGHFIAGVTAQAGARLELRPLPQQDHRDYAWVDPTPGPSGACGNCHSKAYTGWASGAHSRASTSEEFQAYYASLLQDKPNGAGVCSSCHAPGLADDDPALFDLRQVRGALAGVHCDYCHKVADLQPGGTIGLTHGRYLLKLLRPREGQLFFGPLDDVDRDEDAYSPLHRDSRFCAACHEGNLFGVPVYTTYSEWQASPASHRGQQCQDCHSIRQGRTTAHTFWDGDQRAMLQRCLDLEV
ncbi:MAG: multiheme c-type cytochrome, partial [Gemmataceae bacterium]